ncbi:efflux RND transporter periplasmic adaptor subunit [Portibacter marinus]|uniref:efflux RND transporter periplasmic adaptor subunit n=1 Tax=Portibacter marinus TaxID=2898660 RepID=UPI001F23B76B|nr:efflux RND transporter periplasmic adaptor subunit [Portibacter marinus]
MIKKFAYIFFLGSILCLMGCDQEDDASPRPAASSGPRVLKAEAILPKKSKLQEKATSTGSFIAEDQVEISSEVSGYLQSIYFNEGDYKRKGEQLAKINDSELQARKKKLQIDLEYAQQEIQRANKLLEIQAISAEEGDRLANQAKVIQAEIDVLDAQIAKTLILAPFSGRIGVQLKSEGAYLSPGVGIAELHRLNPIKLEFFVPEKLAGTVKQGDEIQFTIPSSSDTFTTKIYLISPSMDENNRSLRMRSRINNNQGQFMPGGYADVFYDIQTEEGSLLIPAEAIIPVLDGQKVMKVERGKVKSQKVEVGMRTATNVQILGGITENDTILVTGILTATDGAPVEATLTEVKSL